MSIGFGSQQSSGSQSGSSNTSSSGTSSALQNTLQQLEQQSQQLSQQQQQGVTSLSQYLGQGLSPELQKILLGNIQGQQGTINSGVSSGLGAASSTLNSGGVASGPVLQNLENLWNSNVNAGVQNLNTETFGPQGLEAQINNQMADRGMGNSSAAVQGAQSVTPYYENALSQILNNANTNYYNAALSEPLQLAGLGLNTASTSYGMQGQTLGSLLSSDTASGGSTQKNTGTSTGETTGNTSSTNTGTSSSSTKASQTSSGTSSGNYTGGSSGFQLGLKGAAASNGAGGLASAVGG